MRSNRRLQSLPRERLLRDCEAVTDDGITYAALALFGKRGWIGKYLPQEEIIFEYRSSDASGPASQREEFRVVFLLAMLLKGHRRSDVGVLSFWTLIIEPLLCFAIFLHSA